MAKRDQPAVAELPRVGIRFPAWSPYGTGVTAGLLREMRRFGDGGQRWRLEIENDSYGEMELTPITADWDGAAVLLFRAAEEELEAFRERGVAVVLTSTEGSSGGFPRVVPDNHRVGEIAAEHLLESCLPRYAFLGRGETVYREAEFASGLRVYTRERMKGFLDRLADYGHEPEVHYVRGRPLWRKDTWKAVQREVVSFLEALPKPCGLFVADDSLGAVALRAAYQLGLRVPDELAVIGFGNDLVYCHTAFPPLSSIRYPGEAVGGEAAKLIARQLAGERLDRNLVVRVQPGTLAVRESSDTVAVADQKLAELVRWLRRESRQKALRVSDLAERSGISLTVLKELFSEHLGHSPKQELIRARLSHLRQQLLESDRPITEIAEEMGFASAHELGRFFLRETGERPGRFRSGLGSGDADKHRQI